LLPSQAESNQVPGLRETAIAVGKFGNLSGRVYSGRGSKIGKAGVHVYLENAHQFGKR